MKYRPEVDGLRALAVVPVIFYHAGFPGFSGGFVGVDVFFVISGYLITTILLKSIEDGSFSLIGFYERRARRILPALFFVVLACTPFAYFFFSPSDLRDYSHLVFGVSSFSSNFFLWKQSGYFSPSSELRPLLHTWSLAVEEQFYLLFPVLLITCWKSARWRYLWQTVLIFFLVSLVLSIMRSARRPEESYFLIHTRAWELLVGSFVAGLGANFPKIEVYSKKAEILALLGLVLIVLAIVTFGPETVFPGSAAAVPVVGTALIICFARSGTLVCRILSGRILVLTGLISYSSYLWHQPLFAVARQLSSESDPDLIIAALTVLTFPLAWLTWRFVERPFRSAHHFSPKLIFQLSFFVLGIGSTFGIAGILTNGFESFKTSKRQRELLETTEASSLREKCHFDRRSELNVFEFCSYFSGIATWAVLGNSHGVELAYALAKALEEKGTALHHLTISDCPSVFGLERQGYCGSWIERAVSYLDARPEVRNIVLSYRNEVATSQQLLALSRTAKRFRESGRNVIVVLQAPLLRRSVDHLIYTAEEYVEGDIPSTRVENWDHVYDRTKKFILSAFGPEIILIDPRDTFCDASFCFAVRNGKALYFDDQHVSLSGAKLIVGQILSRLNI